MFKKKVFLEEEGSNGFKNLDFKDFDLYYRLTKIKVSIDQLSQNRLEINN